MLNMHMFLTQKPGFLLLNNPFVMDSSSKQGKKYLVLEASSVKKHKEYLSE